MLALFSFTGYGSNRQTHLQVLDGIAFFDVNSISLALYSKGLRPTQISATQIKARISLALYSKGLRRMTGCRLDRSMGISLALNSKGLRLSFVNGFRPY